MRCINGVTDGPRPRSQYFTTSLEAREIVRKLMRVANMTDLRCAHCGAVADTIEWFVRFGIFPRSPTRLSSFRNLGVLFPSDWFSIISISATIFVSSTSAISHEYCCCVYWSSSNMGKYTDARRTFTIGKEKSKSADHAVVSITLPSVHLRRGRVSTYGRVFSHFIITASPLKHVKLLSFVRARIAVTSVVLCR